MIDLADVKLYLRVDGDEEDGLIASLIAVGTEITEGVIRKKLTEFETLPESIKQAVMFATATLYENRQGGKNGLDMMTMIDVIKRMTFAYRQEAF